jgi:adenosylmethionine-8-amino-7-oxononanoate aminotransferase
MANPLACAVSLASLDLLAGGEWRADVARISRGLADGLAPAREIPGVRDVRVLGAIGVIELADTVNAPAATQAAVEHSVWLRPFRNLVYTLPPYICNDEDVAQIAGAMVAAARAGSGGA